MKLEWASEFEIGNEYIDLQHRYFLDLINPMSIGYGILVIAPLGPEFAPQAAMVGIHTAVFAGFPRYDAVAPNSNYRPFRPATARLKLFGVRYT